MEDNSLDTRDSQNESLKDFNKKIQKKVKKYFEEPNVKPKEVFEGWKDKKKPKAKSKAKSNKT